ncbi:hypothetical protein ACFL6U_15170 [Planctomycetota bacterium]
MIMNCYDRDGDMGWHSLRIVTQRGLLIALTLGCLSGCYVRPKQSPLTGSFYLNNDKELATIGRVVLVELDNHSEYPEISAEVSEILYAALQKTQLFGITTVDQSDPLWRGLQLELDTTYSVEEMIKIRKTLKSDAVLSGTVTEYRPYPYLKLGLRLRMVDLADGELIWGIEHLWDATDLKSKTRVSHYRKEYLGSVSSESELLEMSHKEFMKFAAFEIGNTLLGQP